MRDMYSWFDFQPRRTIKLLLLALGLAILLTGLPTASFAQELVEAPADFPKYELSNLRVEKDRFHGQVIAFDYRQIESKDKTDTVHEQPHLFGRSDDGPFRIHGFSTIEESGTIRLRDQLAGFPRVFGRGSTDGMEFYFVVGPNQLSAMRLMGRDDGRKDYLVSNVIRHGTMNTTISPRPLNDEEKKEFEAARIARLPPKSVPAGYQRTTVSTPLVPGAPVMIGRKGEWVPATVASVSERTAKVKREQSDYLTTISRDEWMAVSDKTLAKIKDAPDQFSVDFRLLSDGNLLLDESMQPLTDAMSLPKGTPLLLESGRQWKDAWLLSSDNISVRVMLREFRDEKLKMVPVNELAIRKQTIEDAARPEAKQAFALNVADFENQPRGLATFPGSGNESDMPSDDSPAEMPAGNSVTDEPAPLRTWTDLTGKFKIEARLDREDGDDIFLERNDGKIVQLPLAKLSEADREYLKESREQPESADPFANVVSEKATGPDRGLSNGVDYRLPFTTVTEIGDLGWGPASVAISPDNKQVCIGRKGSAVSLCELRTGKVIVATDDMDHVGNVTACGFSPDGKHLVLAGDKGIEVYSVNRRGKMKAESQFAAHERDTLNIAFSADSKHVLTGGADKEARYWELETGRQIAVIDELKGKVKAVCIRPGDGFLLATDGETLIVYDPKTEKTVRKVIVGRSPYSGQAAAFSPNGLLLVCGNSYDFELWNLEKYQQMESIEGDDIPWTIVFSADNQHFFSGHNGTVKVWDAKSGFRVQSTAVGENQYVQAIATNSDGTLIACKSGFKEVTILEAQSDKK